MLQPRSIHPLQHTLQRCRAQYAYLAVKVGPADGLGWVATPDLARAPDALGHIIQSLAQHMRTTDQPYLASLLLINHLQHIGAVGILALLQDRRLPALGVADVAMQYGAAGDVRQMTLLSLQFDALLTDPDVTHPDARRAEAESTLWAELSQQIEAHAAHLIPPLHSLIAASGAKLGARALWLMLADQVASQAIYLAKAVGQVDRSGELVNALVGRDGSALKGKTGVLTIEVDGKRGYFVQRSSCCFIYRAKDGAGRPLNRCQTCPIYSLDDRRHRLMAYVRGQ